MSDLQNYIAERKRSDADFAEGYEEGFAAFKIGAVLRAAREQEGITQERVAEQLQTSKSAISRMENHAEDVKLSTLRRYASALGKTLHFQLE
jgi:HTH-type transcriptional regulator / antitoxin HipB